MTKYKSNPKLSFIKTGWKGNPYKRGRFYFPEAPQPASFKEVLTWMLSKNPQREEKKAEQFSVPVCPFNTLSGEDGITWLGHSSFLIQLDGIRILTDPVFGDIPMHKRKSAFPCDPAALVDIDFLLVSHDHRDHFSPSSAALLLANNPGMQVLLPLNGKQLFPAKVARQRKMQEAGWYQQYHTGTDLQIIFLPAQHWGRRGLRDLNKILWGSFMLVGKDLKIFFGGDSAYDQQLFKEIQELFGPVDICMLPIGAYSPAWFMSKVHMNPEQAVQAFKDLKGSQLIPMHYGTFDLSDEPLGEPLQRLQSCFKERGVGGRLCELKIGEAFHALNLPQAQRSV